MDPGIVGRGHHQRAAGDIAGDPAPGHVLDLAARQTRAQLLAKPGGDDHDACAGGMHEIDLARGDLAAADDEHAPAAQVHEYGVVVHRDRAWRGCLGRAIIPCIRRSDWNRSL